MIPFFSGPFCTAWFVATLTVIQLNPTAASQEKYQLMDKTDLSTKKFDCVIRKWPNPTGCIIGAEVLGKDFVFLTSFIVNIIEMTNKMQLCRTIYYSIVP